MWRSYILLLAEICFHTVKGRALLYNITSMDMFIDPTRNDGKDGINSSGEDYISVSQADYDKWKLAISKDEIPDMYMRGGRHLIDPDGNGGLEIYYRKLYATDWKIVPLMVN
tara:strand:+ start:796 stop:1131 length:336 start_codon:yes stop_codon:yes gene_type:complete